MNPDDAPKRAKQEPYFKIYKAPMRAIANGVDGRNAAFASAVFMAGRWLANDAGQPDGPVALTINQIARRSGVSYNTAKKAIGILRSIRVMDVEERLVPGTKARAPSIYTFPTPWRTSSTAEGTFITEPASSRAEIRKEGKELKESIAPGAAAPRRESDVLFDAMVAAEGAEPSQLTESAKRAINKALKEIREACPAVTPAEINRRVANYRTRMPGMMLTARELAGHWALCNKTDAPQLHFANP